MFPASSGLMNIGLAGMNGMNQGGFMPSIPTPTSNVQTLMSPMSMVGAGGRSLSDTGAKIPGLMPVGEQAPGMFGIEGLGANLETLKLGVGGLASLGNFWSAMEQQKMAKAQFSHQRGILDTNLANSIRSYNTQIEDKYRSRAVVEGQSDAERDANIERNRARDERKG